MQFSFWAIIDSTEIKLQAIGLEEARREAKKLGATSVRGLNPSTKKTFSLQDQ